MFIDQYKDIKDKWIAKSPREAAKWLLANFAERYPPKTIEILDPDTGERKKRVLTWCNIFFTDVVQRLKLSGPYHWVDVKGNPLNFMPGTAVKGYELSANKLIDWFRKYGHGYGWVKVDKKTALQLAQQGNLVAVTYHAGIDSASGHIAVLLDDGTIAQAGRSVFIGKSIEHGFGTKTVEFWAHVETDGETE
jgi:hypothetical protein